MPDVAPALAARQSNRMRAEPIAATEELPSSRFYHGTKADLKRGDLIKVGHASNYGKRKEAAFVYLSATLDAATWGAELALGDGPGRIYVVEPTGPIEDDPNLTDKKFPGNPTKSYRSRDPLRVTGELLDWHGALPRGARGDEGSSRTTQGARNRGDRGVSPRSSA